MSAIAISQNRNRQVRIFKDRWSARKLELVLTLWCLEINPILGFFSLWRISYISSVYVANILNHNNHKNWLTVGPRSVRSFCPASLKSDILQCGTSLPGWTFSLQEFKPHKSIWGGFKRRQQPITELLMWEANFRISWGTLSSGLTWFKTKHVQIQQAAENLQRKRGYATYFSKEHGSGSQRGSVTDAGTAFKDRRQTK